MLITISNMIINTDTIEFMEEIKLQNPDFIPVIERENLKPEKPEQEKPYITKVLLRTRSGAERHINCALEDILNLIRS